MEYSIAHLGTVRGHCGGDIGGPVFLEQVYVALCSVAASHMKEAEQFVHVVVDPELAHGSSSCYNDKEVLFCRRGQKERERI